MLKRPIFIFLAMLVLGALFVFGVFRLFSLRYQAGDVYPPYSTLRADPLGAEAIYEALGELPDVETARNFRPLPRLKNDGPVTLVYAGIERLSYWEERELRAFDALMSGGSRAVFTFFPVDRKPFQVELLRQEREEARKKKERKKTEKEKADKAKDEKPEDKKANDDKKSDDAKKSDDDDDDKPDKSMIKFADVAKEWGFRFDFLPASQDKSYKRTAIAAVADASLEHEISWHSALIFADLSPEWTVLYKCDDKPVVIERKLGSGSVVLTADSFFLSNEALRGERHPLLLARVFGGPRQMIFDEEHHGVRDDPGIATLVRKYRLHGVAVALLLIATLYVWKNSAPFLPPRSERGAEDIIAGKDSAEGFVSLLRRTIAPGAIVGVCVEEWRKVFPHQGRERARLDAVWSAERAQTRGTVATYQALRQSLIHKS